MPKLQCVIFDWAGTTVDYGSISPVKAFMQAFKSAGIEVTEEETRAPMGMLKRDHIKTMLAMPRISEQWVEAYQKDPDEDDIERIYQSFEPSLFSVLEKCSGLKPYVLEAVELLRSQGVKIGSTTGYTASMMKVVTQCAKKQGYEPDCVVTPEETDNLGRPFPYMIFRNMQKLGIKSVKHVMKIGDTLSDIKEAKHAGVFAVGVTQGSSVMGLTKEEWSSLSIVEQDKLNMKAAITFYEAGADFVINSLADIQLAIKVFESKKKK